MLGMFTGVGMLTAAASTGGGDISGTVTDLSTGNGLENISVYLYDASYNFMEGTTTNSAGSYDLPSEGAGTYEVEFVGDGYQSQFYDNETSFATATAVTVSNGSVTGVDAAMQAGGQVTGTVTDAVSGDPVSGIEVDVYSSNSSGSNPVDTVCTASDGTYTVPGLTTGTYYVGFNDGCGASNYAPQFYNGKASLASADPVSVTTGTTTSSIDAAMQAGGQVTGTVTDAVSGDPVSGIEVDVYSSNSSGSNPVDTACTASDGTYTVPGLTTGTYYVGFNDGCGASNYAPQFYNGKASLASAEPVSVTTGTTTSSIDAAMQAGGQVTGTVTDAVSDPVSGIEVDVYSSNSSGSNPVDTACTASDGTYTVPGLTTGTYYVGFNDGCGASNYAPQFYNGKASLASADPVSVTTGTTTSSIDAAIQAGGQVTGTVTDAVSGDPVSGIEVDVYSSKDFLSTPVDTACTASDGTYAVPGLTTGTYYVGFNDGCGASNYVPQFYNGKASLASADSVSVTTGTTTSSIDAAMQAGNEITGTVTDAVSGDPISSVEVDVYSSNSSGSNPVDTVCTASDGTYTVPGLTTGTYYVGFNDGCGASGYSPQFYNGKASLASADPVSVTTGTTTSSIDAAMQAGGQVTGTVTDAVSGDPVSGIEVDVYSSNSSGSNPVDTACTASDGTYTVPGLTTGTYYVGFNDGCGASNYAPQFYNGKASLASADPVSVTTGTTTSSIDAAMQAGGQVTGTVTDAVSGDPVSGIEVRVYSSKTPGSRPVDTVCTASDGTYTVPGLTTGTYYVGFNDGCGASNFAPQFYNGKASLASAEPVSVTTGTTTSSIDAAMQAGGQVTGTVTDAVSGDPVSGIEVDVYSSNSSASTPVSVMCTSSTGSYATAVLPVGTYRVGFNEGNSGLCTANSYSSQFYNGKSSLASSDPVSVTAGIATVVNASLRSAITLEQGAPTSATVSGQGGYTGQLTVTNATGAVTYTEASSAHSTQVVVSSTGAISAATSLAPGIYAVGGTDADAAGDRGAWTFTLTVSPATITLEQGAPTSATVSGQGGYTGQLTVTNATGAVTYTEASSAHSTQVVVSSTGAISAATSLAPGIYAVGGTDADAAGDRGAWTFTLTVSPATITLEQGAPTSATVSGQGGYTGQLTVTNATGAVTYTEASSAHSTQVVVSSTGAISAATSLAPGIYAVGGTDADAAGDRGAWTFTLTVSPATITLEQGAPTSATVSDRGGYRGHHLEQKNARGRVTYSEASSAHSTQVVVSSTGAISAATSLAPGIYAVGGTDADAAGDRGAWTFTLTVSPARHHRCFVHRCITLVQGAPTSATVSDRGGYRGHHLEQKNARGRVTYSEASSAHSTQVVVSSTGAISAATSLAPGIYAVGGTDADAAGDRGAWTFTLTVTPARHHH